MDLLDIQSVGAAIQNMLLAATSAGIGSLWICHIFYAETEISTWVGEESLLVAAVALGHPAERPAPRSRKSVDEVTTWLT